MRLGNNHRDGNWGRGQFQIGKQIRGGSEADWTAAPVSNPCPVSHPSWTLLASDQEPEGGGRGGARPQEETDETSKPSARQRHVHAGKCAAHGAPSPWRRDPGVLSICRPPPNRRRVCARTDAYLYRRTKTAGAAASPSPSICRPSPRRLIDGRARIRAEREEGGWAEPAIKPQ